MEDGGFAVEGTHITIKISQSYAITDHRRVSSAFVDVDIQFSLVSQDSIVGFALPKSSEVQDGEVAVYSHHH